MPEKNIPKKVSLKVDSSTGKFVVSDILSTRKSPRAAVPPKKKVPVADTDMPASAFERPRLVTGSRISEMRGSSALSGLPHDPTPLEEWLEKNKEERAARDAERAQHAGPTEELPTPEAHKMFPPRPSSSVHPKRRWFLFVAAIAAFLAIGYIASQKFAKLYVTVYPRIEHKTVASDVLVSATPSSTAIPGELITFTHMEEREFPASILKDVHKKASGTIIVFNTISSIPQNVVANTRFEAKNGRIYRIQNPLTIPAATIKDGKLASAGVIEALVVADQPGSEYNSDLTEFTIPGFKGTDKYKGFYAKSKTPMTGGFIGKSYVPTDGDLAKAEEALASEAKTKATSDLAQKIPAGFVLVDGAADFVQSFKVIDREAVHDQKTFLARQTTEVRALLYRQTDLVAKIAEVNNIPKGLVEIKNPDGVSVSISRKDMKTGTMTMRVAGDAMFLWKINNEELVRALADAKSPSDFQAIFKKYPAITKAEAIFSLPWVRTVPANLDNIRIQTKGN